MSTTRRTARTDARGRAFKGSQRQIQLYVNEHVEELSRSVIEALPSLKSQDPHLRWVSPLDREDSVEYYDQGFLHAVEQPQLTEALIKFWPRSGPRWDALAIVEVGGERAEQGVLLVEAKSHRLEVCGTGTHALPHQLEYIMKSLANTAHWLGVPWNGKREDIWTGMFYQYANRLAYLYFLKEIAHMPTWLVNIYFVNDPHRPTSREQWKDFLAEVKLDVTGRRDFSHELVADVFLEAKS